MQNLLMLLKKSSFSLWFFILLFVSIKGYAQKVNLTSDLILIDSVAKQRITSTAKRNYIFKDQPKTFKNSNPVSLIIGGSLYVYQNVLSQHLSASCLYHPSCSDFGKHAVKEFGLIKGTLLSFDRLNRCNRIAATDLNFDDIDPHSHRFSDSVKTYEKNKHE
jgi:putative component of membrane protein insertase Oxa1/YidC/SpoIIIJ protein YidD